MANLNRVELIGRLTRDVEVKTFSNGGKVAQFGFAVTGSRKKNPSTGQWEDEPCFLDVKAFNSEHRKLADLCESSLSKGVQCYIGGHLVYEQWEKDGVKRSALRVVVEDVQFLEPRKEGQSRSAPQQRQSPSRQENTYSEEPGRGVPEDEIPF